MPFQPGNKLGHGRPSFAQSIQRRLRSRLPTGEKVTDAIVNVAIGLALDGDLRAIEFLVERVEGKPMQRQEIEHTIIDSEGAYERIAGRLARQIAAFAAAGSAPGGNGTGPEVPAET